MNIKKLLIAITVLLGITACGPDSVDHSFATELCYSNCSSHTITLTIDKPKGSNNTPLVVTLKPSEMYKSVEITLQVLDRGCSVLFDNNVLIDYKKCPITSEYNILSSSNYTATHPDEWYIVYTYTFTDADYQFALENGTAVE